MLGNIGIEIGWKIKNTLISKINQNQIQKRKTDECVHICDGVRAYMDTRVYVRAFTCVSVHGKKANDGACFVCAAVAMDFLFVPLLLLLHMCTCQVNERARYRGGGRRRMNKFWVVLKVLPIWNVCVSETCVYVCVLSSSIAVYSIDGERERKPTMAAYSFASLYYMVLSMYIFIVIRFRHYLIWYSDLIPMNTIRCIQFQLDTHYDFYFFHGHCRRQINGIQLVIPIENMFSTRKIRCFNTVKIDSQSTPFAYIYKKRKKQFHEEREKMFIWNIR